MTIFEQNLSAIQLRYPALAERVIAFPARANLVAFEAKDGGIAYALQSETDVQYLTDPVTPLTRIGNQLEANSAKLNDFTIPVMLIGTYPGDELLYVYDLCEKAPPNHAQQKIYVCVDSLPCFCAFLQTIDARRVLLSNRVKLFWHEEVEALAQEFSAKPELSYLFTLVSGSLNGTVNRVMAPFIRLVQERSTETQRLMAENEAYYNAISDEELAEVIGQKSETANGRNGETAIKETCQGAEILTPALPAPRSPRLMTLTSSWSNVTQYSTRDLCEALQANGWETRWFNVDETPTAHFIVKQINEFKPDVFLFINHLRTEVPILYPTNLMFITWIQDTVPQINSKETAQKWNEWVNGRNGETATENKKSEREGEQPARRSLARSLGTREPSSSPSLPLRPSMSRHSPHGTTADVQKSSSESPISGFPPSLNELWRAGNSHPSSRRRDLIIGYVSQLEKYGYLKDRLVEMPMIVNPNVFKPRTLTDEQKAKYGCDVMFASNGSKPTDQIVREILVPEFEGLRPEDRSQESLANSQENEIQTKGNKENKVHEPPLLTSLPSVKNAPPSGLKSPDSSFSSVSGFKSQVSSFSSPSGLPPSLKELWRAGSPQPSSLFDESLLMRIHDHLWSQYRAEKTFTSYTALEHELQNIEGFASAYDSLSEDDRDHVIQTIFWRLNDVIYRHVVLEWLDEMAQGAEDRTQKSEREGEQPAPSLTSLPFVQYSCAEPQVSLRRSGATPGHSNSSEPQVSGFRFHPSLKLHLYGKGWENHPRFAKYAKGELAHGEELSIAYQAAKCCLHLNSGESEHQRLKEALATEANPIFRYSESAMELQSELISVLRTILASDSTRNSLSLTNQDLTIWNNWMFNSLLQATKKVPTISREEIQLQLQRSIEQNVADFNQREFAKEQTGAFRNKLDLAILIGRSDIKLASHSSQETVHPGRQAEEIKAVIDKLIALLAGRGAHQHNCRLPNLPAAIELLELLAQEDAGAQQFISLLNDISPPCPEILRSAATRLIAAGKLDLVHSILDNVTPEYLSAELLLNFASTLFQNDSPEKASTVIRHAYALDSEAKDGYAQIARNHLWPKGHIRESISWFILDETAGRLSSEQQLNLAHAYAVIGDLATSTKHVEAAYARNPNLTDGFAFIGWQNYWDQRNFSSALKWLQRDETLNRLSPAWHEHLAEAYAVNGQIVKSVQIVEQAYAHDVGLTDWFVVIAMALVKSRILHNKSNSVLELIDKDRTLKRLSTKTKLLASKYYIWALRFEEAETLVTEAYVEDPLARDGFSRLAVAALANGHDMRAMSYWQKDREASRETRHSAMCHDFIARKVWQGKTGPVYVYRFYDDPAFEEILPLLAQLHSEAESQVMIETPVDAPSNFDCADFGWKISNGTVFGSDQTPTGIPCCWPRISYRGLSHRYPKHSSESKL